MREMMFDVMHLRSDPLPKLGLKFAAIVRIERLLNRCRTPNVLDFLLNQFRMWKMCQDKREPPPVVHARFSIDRNVIDLA